MTTKIPDLLADARRERLNTETVARCAYALRVRHNTPEAVAAWLAGFARRWDHEERQAS